MSSLRIIENELVPVYETSTGEKVVYGSELYAILEVKSNYRDWSKNRLNDCEAVENEDYESFAKNLAKGGRPQIDHIIKLDTAKEMAMLERNEKGKQVRRYFIQIEKKYREQAQKPLSALDQLRLQSQAIMEVDEKVDAINKDLQDFKRNLPLLPAEAELLVYKINKRAVAALGGKESNAYKDSSLRGKVYSDIHRELKRQFGVSKYKYIKGSQLETAISVVEEYELPLILQEQIKDCNAQISMGVA